MRGSGVWDLEITETINEFRYEKTNIKKGCIVLIMVKNNKMMRVGNKID